MDQNEYNYIMQQGAKPSSPFGGNSKKQRILVVAIGGLFLLVVGIILVSVLAGSSKSTAELLAPLAGAQTDLIEITEIGEKEARDSALRNQTASTNAAITTHYGNTSSAIGKDSKKLSALYQNSEYKKELEDAKNAGKFDKVYQAILTNRLDLYRQLLVSSYKQAPSAKLKKELEAYYSQVGVLLGEPTKPQ